MKKSIVLLLFSVLLMSCNNELTLQKYFVNNTDAPNFMAIDMDPGMLNIDKTKLTADEASALKAFDKINILTFKATEQNKAKFEAERVKVAGILKEKSYDELMKFGSGKDGVAVYSVGEGEHIKEFVIYANKKDNGFAIVRVLGTNMTPNHVMTLMSVLKHSDIKSDQLKSLADFMK
ncbi:DUF4252 domain-containing protein [Flavobacterium kingsejongi]|uniref:DUF4252 domain-containing protein n=1 Tax=Flavobacterium kingsejongi TaxID=1678728 RepID=A0A2S1LTM2_9FLAO|nr:DUF4252 domain-containing protein [Flavobacterium kingsejongi]AWG27115.1 hypothetical protein FK004_18775 [Flavobacterium kingsejongi]